MRVNTPGGVFSVRWDARGSATALGQLAFFAEYLDATGLFEAWLKWARSWRCKFSRELPGADLRSGWCGWGPLSDDLPLSRF